MELPLRQNDGTLALGMVPFKPAAVMQAEELAAQKAQQDSQQRRMVSDSLSSYIETCWSDAKEAKLTVEAQLMKNQRQRSGIYEQDQLAAIAAMGGSDVYVLLTATKCRAAVAWLNSLMRPSNDHPWDLEPTPISDLPGNILERIQTEAEAVGTEAVEQVMQVAGMIDEDLLTAELAEFMEKRKDALMKEIQEEAELGADRMSLLIADQMAEGGYHEAFWQSVDDLVTYKAGILKGPVIRRRKNKQWKQEMDGKWKVVVEDKFVPEFSRVSPFDLYPAPSSRNPDDGYLIERHKLTRSELQAMIGVPGYSEENIRQVLKDYGTGLSNLLSIDAERAPIEFSGSSNLYKQAGDKIEALEFWGSVQGSMLAEWGMKGDIDPLIDYEVNAWKVGNYVIRAIINPDQLGKKPYSVDSWERVPGSFWGRGVPELMSDVQNVCNSLARSIVNNAGIASGPQVEVNTDRCDEDENIHPWKIWPTTNGQMNDAPAVRFTTPPCIVEPLLRVFDHFSTQAEDQTGIPRWANGRSNPGDASSTASGLQALMDNASRGVQEVVSHIDTMVSSLLRRLYDYNMAYSDDESIKRDCKIVVRGSSALLQKNQRQQQLTQLLAQTNNPTDMQIIGIEGRAKLLSESINATEIRAKDVVPLKDELKELVAKIEKQQADLMAQGQNPGQGKGVAPQAGQPSLDPHGDPAGGEAANMFQNQEGVSNNQNPVSPE